MHGADMVGHHLGLGKVGRALQADGKGVQAGPVGAGLGVVLDTVFAELLGNGGDDAGVQTAAEQHAIGDITHQLALNGGLEAIADCLDTCLIIFHSIILHPVATIIAF